MKKMLSRMVLGLAMVTMTSVMALAENKAEKVNFFRDIVVNGTVVKKGTYQVTFNEQNGEIVIQSGKKEIAKTPARLENRSTRSENTEVKVTSKDDKSVLRSITFAGDNQTIIVNEPADQAVAPQ
jgi:hypothetical protein